MPAVAPSFDKLCVHVSKWSNDQ